MGTWLLQPSSFSPRLVWPENHNFKKLGIRKEEKMDQKICGVWTMASFFSTGKILFPVPPFADKIQGYGLSLFWTVWKESGGMPCFHNINHWTEQHFSGASGHNIIEKGVTSGSAGTHSYGSNCNILFRKETRSFAWASELATGNP